MMFFIHRMLTEKKGRGRKIWKKGVAEGSEEEESTNGRKQKNKTRRKEKKNKQTETNLSMCK
jgi:hypothetical protein